MGEPTKVDFFQGDYRRRVADDGPIFLKNRYYEVNPHLSADGASLLARPSLSYLTEVGVGPNRGVFTEEGSFNGNLFVAQYDQLWRIDSTLVATLIYTGLNNPERGVVNMASTAPIGDEVPEYLFFADGRNLFIYVENGYATGTLSGTPTNGDVVRLGTVYYQFTNGSVNAGAPAGTLANPWLVAHSVNSLAAYANLATAIGAAGNAGVDYSTGLTTANGQAQAVTYTGGLLVAEALSMGLIGNAVVTTETGTLAWSGATLAGGGNPQVRAVQMPEDLGAVDVVVMNSFVFVLPVQSGNFKGRVYYIEPGETTVDPLNYFTAERSPDAVNGLEVVGDLLWLPGDGSTEAWYVSQDPSARMQRLQGVVFDRGTWEGTAVAVHEALIVCDANGAVFEITGGSPKRLSTPGIEEEIRRAIAFQQSLTP